MMGYTLLSGIAGLLMGLVLADLGLTHRDWRFWAILLIACAWSTCSLIQGHLRGSICGRGRRA